MNSWLSRRSFVRGVLRPDRPKSVLSMNSSSSTIEITERSVNDLRPPERSVRTHNRAQERKLTRIIRKHGIVAPIIADPDGNIINGVLVWKLCKKLGFDSVPTVAVRANDPATVKALRIALNRVAEDAGWGKENLRDELKYLLEVDYELDLTGFDAPEIDAILEIETPTIGVAPANSAGAGLSRGAGVVFFAYIGFDAVSTAAQEAGNPQRDMPIGILGSLAICTLPYVLVSLVITGIVPFNELNVPDPIALGASGSAGSPPSSSSARSSD